MGVTSVSCVTSVAQTSTTHPPPQPQHKVSVFFTSNFSLLTYIYRIQAFFSERNHPKVRKRAPGKSLPPPHLQVTKKHPQTCALAERTTCASPGRSTDVAIVKNCAHDTRKQNEKSVFFFIFAVSTNAPRNTTSLTRSPPQALLPHTPNHHHPTARPQRAQMRIW
jgi:hypothetical protein